MNTKNMLVRFLAMASAAIALGGTALAQVNSDITLIVRDNGSGADTLRWGVNATATNGKDAALGEEEQPPAPPDGVFDARWINVGTSNNFGQGVKKNYHANNASLRDTFRLKVQPGSGGYPMTLTWPNLSSYFGTASLRFVDGDGNASTMDMKTGTTFTFNNPSSNSSTITITTFQPAAPAAGVSASPSPLNLGIVALPSPGTKTDSITVTNTGASSITVDSVVSTDSHFVVATPPTYPRTLGAGASFKFGVVFTATAGGSYSGTIKVYHSVAGSPLNIPVQANASSGEGLFLSTTHKDLMDNRANFYHDTIGLKYSGGTALQGLQFKLTAPTNKLKIKKVELGSAFANPLDWNFDYEISNAASGSEVLVILYGKDTTKNLPADTYPNLFKVTYDVKNITVCNDTLGGDTVNAITYLNSVQSSLATNLGESAGVGVDPDRDTASYTLHNSADRGDVNCDDRVDVLDILEIVDYILGRQSFAPWQINRADLAPWSPTWTPAGVQIFDDANNYGDHTVNVQDVTLIANAILNEEWPDAIQLFKANGGVDLLGGELGTGDVDVPMAIPGTSSVYDVKFRYLISGTGIDVEMENLVPVKGIQMKLKAADAPADLDAKLASAIEGNFTVQKLVTDGEIRILIYSLSGDVFNVSKGRLMQILYPVTNPGAIAVIEPITVGGADNRGVKVEYEVVNTSGVERDEMARSFALENMPNPFSATTSIRYTLKNSMNVTLVVTDTKGAEVVRILDNKVQSAGDHTVELNADAYGLASGTYFCKLTAGGASTVQQMVVAK
jgi:hypothetical protein